MLCGICIRKLTGGLGLIATGGVIQVISRNGERSEYAKDFTPLPFGGLSSHVYIDPFVHRK